MGGRQPLWVPPGRQPLWVPPRRQPSRRLLVYPLRLSQLRISLPRVLLSLLLSMEPFVSQPDFDLLALFPDKELCYCFLCVRALKLNTTPHDTLPSFLDVLSMHSCLSVSPQLFAPICF